MGPCPNQNVLWALVSGKLARNVALRLQAHVDTCPSCHGTVADARKDETLETPEVFRRTTQPELEPGSVVDSRFVLERVLGEGGVGKVWQARQLSDGARFALKVLRAPVPDQVRRLLREAILSQRVQHPAFVPVREVLEVRRGHPALRMEVLEGADMEALLQGRAALSIAECAAWLAPIAHALVALHAQSIAHRDLKPANVFLERHTQGAARIRILDLGIARSLSLEQSTVITPTGAILGTPRYMSPEQLNGAADIDVRADIWALGAIAYRLLSGRPHIASSTLFDVMREVFTTEIAPLSQYTVGLPEKLLQLTDASLQRQATPRPSASDWLAVLETLKHEV
jgi:eukaryotic-like serine/threonine-protein kinase